MTPSAFDTRSVTAYSLRKPLRTVCSGHTPRRLAQYGSTFLSAVALVLGTTALALTATPATAQTRTSQDGVYTAAQATRGGSLYSENCAACHGGVLEGDPNAPALSGASFAAKWSGRPLSELHDVMRNTMPQNFPGGLSRQQNADLLAYLLQRNRMPAGQAELPAQTETLAAIRFAAPAAAAGATAPAPAAAPARPASPAAAALAPVDGGFYTVEQADRGKLQFDKVCTPCHVAAAQMPRPGTSGRGFWLGSQHLLLSLGGTYTHKYPSVYHLFRRIRDSMPSSDADSVSEAAKVDIVAYLLREGGFAPGRTALPLNTTAMKKMRLGGLAVLEKGFEAVFNGKDFSGLGFLLGPNCRPQPEGCGRTEPGTIFRAENGSIVTTGKVQGYMYTQKKYQNFTLRFDVRHVPPADWDPTEDFFDGNSGYLLFVTEHRVWPKGIEIQGNHMTMLSPIGMDAMAKYTEDHEALVRARKPAGQWQSVEIVSKDGQVKSYLNGVLVSTVTEHEFKAPGYIGFQSEGAELHWRNIRIRPE